MMDPTSLGRLLLDSGAVTITDIHDGLRHAEEVTFERRRIIPDAGEMRLGEALVDLGRINEALLDAILAQQDLERTTSTANKARAAAGMVVAASAAATGMHPQLDALANTALNIINGLGKA
jgi:hypothetical protein